MSEVVHPPEKDFSDFLYEVVLASVGIVVPLPGVLEVAKAIFKSPFQQKLILWMIDVTKKLNETLTHADLRALMANPELNPELLDTISHATLIILRNNQRKKREALLNAVGHSAQRTPPDASLQQIFLNYIEYLTEWHFIILEYADNPREWIEHNNPGMFYDGTIGEPIERIFPELSKYPGFSKQLWDDLWQRGLLTSSGETTWVQTSMERHTTELGSDFLRFTQNA